MDYKNPKEMKNLRQINNRNLRNMKKSLLFSIVMLCSFGIHSQEVGPTGPQKGITGPILAKRHELGSDVISAITIPALNPRYEYLLGKYSGIGAEVFVSLDDDNGNSDHERFSIAPYYRQYFFSERDYGAKGFYAEGFAKFFTFGERVRNGNNSTTKENFFDTSIGAGIGWKWVSRSGFFVDLGFGIGRNLGLPGNKNVGEKVQFRGGLNFGWRF